MGHTWRDMDPEGAAESDSSIESESKLMAQLENVPVRKLNMGDLIRLINVIRPKYDMHSFDRADEKTLQKIIKKAKNA